MSRAAWTSRSSYSSGMPKIAHITIIGRWSANWLTRSALPFSEKSLTRRLLKRLMWRRTPRVSMRSMLSVTAPRCRSCLAPSAKTQTGCQVKIGASGWSGATLPSWRARQRRESRENWDGVRVRWRFSLWPRTSQAGTSPWSRTGATVPCSARSLS
ncbi:hypothetical protein SCYAM73S_08237 [Streptomyces cyaneofuscatus]